MADDDSTTDTAPPATDDAPPAVTTADPLALAQAEADKWKRLSRENEKQAKANADAARRLAGIEESQKTETQKLTERAEAAERRATEIEGKALRADVALAKGLTPSQAKRLVGSTEAELMADADDLLADMKVAAPRRGAVDQGERVATKPGQLGKDDLKGMTPQQIVAAKKDGRLSGLLSGADR